MSARAATAPFVPRFAVKKRQRRRLQMLQAAPTAQAPSGQKAKAQIEDPGAVSGSQGRHAKCSRSYIVHHDHFQMHFAWLLWVLGGHVGLGLLLAQNAGLSFANCICKPRFHIAHLAATRQAFDDSMQLVDDIVKEVCGKGELDAAAALVTNQPLDKEAHQAVEYAVAKRLSRFNQMTLHTLNQIIEAPTLQENSLLQKVLQDVKQQILVQVSTAMAPEMMELDQLVQLPGQQERADAAKVPLLGTSIASNRVSATPLCAVPTAETLKWHNKARQRATYLSHMLHKCLSKQRVQRTVRLCVCHKYNACRGRASLACRSCQWTSLLPWCSRRTRCCKTWRRQWQSQMCACFAAWCLRSRH